MRILATSLLWLLAGTAGSAGAAESSTDGLVVFSSHARVEVDATGNVVDVQEDATLPAEIGQALDARIRGWKFAAPLRNGVPVGGVTYVRVGACAAPIETGGYRLAFQYNGNGPRNAAANAPGYPRDALRARIEGEYKVTYRVQTDGKAVVESVEPLGPGRAGLKYFEPAIQAWVAAMTYQPELLDGQAVATRLSFPVSFEITSEVRRGRSHRTSDKESERKKKEQSPSCQVALGHLAEQDRTVVLDSPFKRVASN